MNNDTELSTAQGKRIIKNQTGKRVSKDAAIQLLEEMEETGKEISEKANELANRDDRKTVRAGDIRTALRLMK